MLKIFASLVIVFNYNIELPNPRACKKDKSFKALKSAAKMPRRMDFLVLKRRVLANTEISRTNINQCFSEVLIKLSSDNSFENLNYLKNVAYFREREDRLIIPLSLSSLATFADVLAVCGKTRL